MSDQELFAGLTIERTDDALPKRIVAGRESIPNPFLDAVMDSYQESKDPAKKDSAVRVIFVPVDAKSTTVRTVTRKDKSGNVTATQWQQHPNVNTALYLLRQAAIKKDIGVRIVVDYAQENVPTLTHKVTVTDKDGKPVMVKDGDKEVEKTETITLKDVTLNKFTPATGGAHKGRLRIRFLGQEKKADKKSDKNAAPESTVAA